MSALSAKWENDSVAINIIEININLSFFHKIEVEQLSHFFCAQEHFSALKLGLKLKPKKVLRTVLWMERRMVINFLAIDCQVKIGHSSGWGSFAPLAALLRRSHLEECTLITAHRTNLHRKWKEKKRKLNVIWWSFTLMGGSLSLYCMMRMCVKHNDQRAIRPKSVSQFVSVCIVIVVVFFVRDFHFSLTFPHLQFRLFLLRLLLLVGDLLFCFFLSFPYLIKKISSTYHFTN